MRPSRKETTFKALRPAALALVFFAALFGAGSLLARVRPLANVPVAWEKFAHFSAHSDDYDVIFIGTSRVYRGIIPARFDAITAAAGVPTHSFNFGIDAMRPPEDGFIIDQLLALRPRKLRWVFIELGPLHTEFGERDPESVRVVHWHDWPRTVLVCRGLLAPKGRLIRLRSLLFGNANDRARFRHALTHLRLCAMRTLNLGRARAVLDSWDAAKSAPLGDGFATTPVQRMTPEATAEYLRDAAARTPRRSDLDPASCLALDRLVAGIRRAGAEPIFINSPRLSGSPIHPANHPGVPVLDFMDQRAWPELYAPEIRSDSTHLNALGADVYSRVVARRFIEATRD